MASASLEIMAPSLGVSERRDWHLDTHPELIASLTALALGALLTTGCFAKLYMAEGAAVSQCFAFAAIGCSIVFASAAWTLRQLRGLPGCHMDCERYGRHMIGLTYLLLLLGVCNGLGTSILALEGGLSYSASDLQRAIDPKQFDEAYKKHEAAREVLQRKERMISDAKRKLVRAQRNVARVCANGTGADQGQSRDCDAAQIILLDVEDEVIRTNYEYDNAYAAAEDLQQLCVRIRKLGREALFFLLSVSTMMSLFGATFYVVNRVRTKRPLLTGDSDDEVDENRDSASAADATPATSAAISSIPPTAAANTTADAVPDAQRTTKQSVANASHTEAFDVHAFWSGAFFRVGEAVLFTFAFFWLIWTSGDRTHVVWLPVLGLFVGMFVRTGEAVIFRLGERLLLATQSLLPSVDSTPRQPPKPPRS